MAAAAASGTVRHGWSPRCLRERVRRAVIMATAVWHVVGHGKETLPGLTDA